MLALEVRAHARAEETFFYPLLADQGVEEGRLADVGDPNDADET